MRCHPRTNAPRRPRTGPPVIDDGHDAGLHGVYRYGESDELAPSPSRDPRPDPLTPSERSLVSSGSLATVSTRSAAPRARPVDGPVFTGGRRDAGEYASPEQSLNRSAGQQRLRTDPKRNIPPGYDRVAPPPADVRNDRSTADIRRGIRRRRCRCMGGRVGIETTPAGLAGRPRDRPRPNCRPTCVAAGLGPIQRASRHSRWSRGCCRWGRT